MMKRIFLGTALLCISLAFWSCTPSLGSDSSGGVAGDLRGDVTWSTDTYVSGNLIVYGKLTISPGVTVTLANDVELVVDGTGGLYALGTADKPIAFKAKDSSEGWDCISFTENADTNTLSHCDISGAGSDGGYAIVFTSIGSAEAGIDNCAIHGNKGGGIDASYADSGTRILSNRFYGNSGFPLSINQKVACDSTNLFHEGVSAAAASASNCVEFRGEVSQAVEFSIKERPYYIPDGINVSSALTVDAGVTVWVGDGKRIVIEGNNSSFSAEGTADARIGFCARNGTDKWDCLYFDEYADVNSLKYCSISGAGSLGAYALTYSSVGSISATLAHCSFFGNLHGGIGVQYSGSTAAIQTCQFGDNGDSAAGIYDIYSYGYDISAAVSDGNTAISGTNALTVHDSSLD
jgi:hypothetical protein